MSNSKELQRIMRMNGFDPNLRVLTYDGRTQHKAFDQFLEVTDVGAGGLTMLSGRAVLPWQVGDRDVIYLGAATVHPGPMQGKHFVYGSSLRKVLADTLQARMWRMFELVDPQTWVERKRG